MIHVTRMSLFRLFLFLSVMALSPSISGAAQVVGLPCGLDSGPAAGQASAAPVPIDVTSEVPPADSGQMILVLAEDWDAPVAELRRFERGGPDQPWRQAGESAAVNLGRNGLGWGRGLHRAAETCEALGGPVKAEGDGKAPAGVFRLTGLFAYDPAELQGAAMPVLDLGRAEAEGRGWRCVDDTASRFYNQLVQDTADKDWNSSETMLRPDHLYRWGALAAHNAEPSKPGAGSCIFLHIERGPGSPTAGCTSLDEGRARNLFLWLDQTRDPVLVQLPRAAYEALRAAWKLP